jgi:hypothetical protein
MAELRATSSFPEAASKYGTGQRLINRRLLTPTAAANRWKFGVPIPVTLIENHEMKEEKKSG